MKNLTEEKSILVKKCIGIYRGTEILNFDPVTVMPVETFLQHLHGRALF
jgi:hypothetical protein